MPPGETTPFSLDTAFAHHDAHPVVLYLLLNHLFGRLWVTWEPETLWSEIRQSSPGGRWEVSELNRNKIQACRTVLQTSSFAGQWEIFVPVINALNNVIPRFDTLDKPSIARMWDGVDIIQALTPTEFMGDVPAFVAAAALDDDVCWLPEPLEFANKELNRKIYVCQECGNFDDLDDDGLCDVCTARFNKVNNLDLKPHPTRVAEGHGSNLEVGYKYEWRPVKERYAELSKVSYDEVYKHLKEDDSTDAQVARLLVAKAYSEHREGQMADQMEVLGSWVRPH